MSQNIELYKHTIGELKLDEKPFFIVNVGSNDLNVTEVTTNTYSDSSLTISYNPPQGSSVLDLLCYLRIPVRLELTGTVQPGQTLLQKGLFSIRSFPISKITDNMKISIDNSSIVMLPNQQMVFYERYIKNDTKRRDLSGCISQSDNYQKYSDFLYYGNGKNPMALDGDNNFGAELSAGNSNFVIESNPVNGTGVPAVLTSVVYVELLEPIFAQPFYWRHGSNNRGLTLVTQLIFYCGFANLSRCVRICNDVPGGSVVTNIQTRIDNGNYFGLPALLIRNLQYGDGYSQIPRELTYSYSDQSVYKTDVGSIGPYQIKTSTSNNIQLNQTPRRIYICVKRKQQDETAFTTDTFMNIQNISLNWNNRNGILASANSFQLYQISVKNGFQGSFTQWDGYSGFTKPGTPIGVKDSGCGSCVALDLGSDVPLSPSDSPSLLSQSQLSVQVTYRNLTDETINCELDILVINSGVLIKSLNDTKTYTGILSRNDVLSSPELPSVQSELVELAQGGNFLKSIEGVVQKAKPYVQRGMQVARTAVDVGKKILPYAERGLELAAMVGLGEDGTYTEEEVRKMMGGKMASRKKLQNRLRNY